MLFAIIILTLLATLRSVRADNLQTTSPVSIILDGLTLQRWIEQSLWNQTQTSIVHHLNEFCKKDYHCDAEYGIGNVHLLNAVQHGSSSIRLNITADKPVLPLSAKLANSPALYNYTALLTGALFQTKLDIERLHDKHLLYSSTYFNEDSTVTRTTRLLFVFLGIVLVAIIFGLTVLFFQRIRHHSYSKLLKNPRLCQTTTNDPLTDSPLTAVLHE